MIYDGVEYEERYGYWHAVRNVSNHNSYLTLPEEIQGKQVIGIDAHVFADNEKIQVVEIPATITEIDNYAFAGCTNLHTVKERCSRASYKGTPRQVPRNWDAESFGSFQRYHKPFASDD